ncbi:hypothetical protein [uncultured Tenacibaculum sp.]|uniref:hypothetical protein n=1 Tax=uncultured Tenacibaculum sp. TaxID=174713 RepID=UPI00260D3FF7|nr:hypothetical protein [uncultured Tenacibaculum sp.]
MRIAITVVLFWYSLITSAQEIEGKWLVSLGNSLDVNSVPTVYIIEFKNGAVKSYGFDGSLSIIDQGRYSIIKDSIKIYYDKQTVVRPYRFIKENMLEVDYVLNNNGNKSIYSILYVKIIPTITKLTKEEIEESIYGTSIGVVDFDKDLEKYKGEIKKENQDFFKEKFFVQKIDETFVISTYSAGKIKDVALVKVVNSKEMILFGVRVDSSEMVLKNMNSKN